MEKTMLFIFAVCLLMMCHGMEAWKDVAGVIHVGGKVMCQDCSQGYDEWAHGLRPIQGCKVAIMCADERNRVVYYGSDETDEEGDFKMLVEKQIKGKELKAEGCSVRLISSPDHTCNILTDFAGGQSGKKLGRPCSVNRDLVKYDVGTFYFTPPMCEEPDRSDDSPSEGSNY